MSQVRPVIGAALGVLSPPLTRGLSVVQQAALVGRGDGLVAGGDAELAVGAVRL